MKNKNKISFFLALCFMQVICLNLSSAENADVDAARQLMINEQIERQEQQLNANLLVGKANQNFIDKKYETARDQCLKAINILSEISPLHSSTESKIMKVKDLLGMIYSYWAEDILKEADNNADSGRLKDAIKLCLQAAEMNPKLRAHSDRQIEKFEQKIKENQYKDLTAESSFNPDYKKTLYNIDVLYEQAKKLYKNKSYTKAKNKLEELLILDPYNSNAIYYLKLINSKIYYAGQNREAATSNKRIAESEWKTLSPIVAKTLSGNRIDIASTVPISKEQNIEIIHRKLNDIIIKHIAFEDVPIKTAIMFLKRESKKLDIEGKGINIFLRINERTEEEENGSEPDETATDENFDTPDTDDTEEDFAEQYLITMVLDNVPLGKAIEYVCAAADLKYNVSNYAVEISSSDISTDMRTVVIPIDKAQYINVVTIGEDSTIYTANLEQFFTEHGVTFTEGASAVFDAKISRLIVRNTPAEISKITKLITKLNKDTPQVSISAKFVEIQQKDFEELGFEWRTSKTSGNITWENNDPINRYAMELDSEDPKLDRILGVNYTGPNGLTLNGVIHALDQNEKVNLLSAPKVTTLSGQKATIKMTTETYYATEWTAPSLTSQDNEYYYLPPAPTFEDPTENGIVFSVTPFVESDHYTIDLELEPKIQKFVKYSEYSYDIRDPAGNLITPAPVIKMPIFKVQSIQTHLKIYDGETVVMGGVTKDATMNVDDRIPILGDVPLFGSYFRTQGEIADKENLLILPKLS